MVGCAFVGAFEVPASGRHYGMMHGLPASGRHYPTWPGHRGFRDQ